MNRTITGKGVGTDRTAPEITPADIRTRDTAAFVWEICAE